MTYPPWTRREAALLGTMSDEEVAHRPDRTLSSLKAKRVALKIPNRYLKNRVWSPEELARLGQDPDGVLARRWGRTLPAVTTRRRTLRIRAFGGQ